MSEFFDTYFNVSKIIKDKREYREQMARVKALPDDYRFVFEKLQQYMWVYAGGDGMDMLKVHYDLIELFEEGAASDKSVLEITGKDVAGFADELLKNVKTWQEKYTEKLNRDVAKRFKKR